MIKKCEKEVLSYVFEHRLFEPLTYGFQRQKKSRPLIVGSCGTYRLSRHPKLPTYRPRGRLDYQIIYITAGCGHFHLIM